MIRAMVIRGMSRRTLALVGAVVGVLVVAGLVVAVVVLAAGGGAEPAVAVSPSPSPTLRADDPGVVLARADGLSPTAGQAAEYSRMAGEAAAACHGTVSQVLFYAPQVPPVVEKYMGERPSLYGVLSAWALRGPWQSCTAPMLAISSGEVRAGTDVPAP